LNRPGSPLTGYTRRGVERERLLAGVKPAVLRHDRKRALKLDRILCVPFEDEARQVAWVIHSKTADSIGFDDHRNIDDGILVGEIERHLHIDGLFVHIQDDDRLVSLQRERTGGRQVTIRKHPNRFTNCVFHENLLLSFSWRDYP